MSDNEKEQLAELLSKLEDEVNSDEDLTEYGKDTVNSAIRVLNDHLR